MAEHLTSTKARVAAHKGHLSRDIAAVKRAVVFLDGNPSAAARKQVNDIFDKITARKENIANLYEDLIELEPAKMNEYNAKLDELEAAFDTAMNMSLWLPCINLTQRPPMHKMAHCKGGQTRVRN